MIAHHHHHLLLWPHLLLSLLFRSLSALLVLSTPGKLQTGLGICGTLCRDSPSVPAACFFTLFRSLLRCHFSVRFSLTHPFKVCNPNSPAFSLLPIFLHCTYHLPTGYSVAGGRMCSFPLWKPKLVGGNLPSPYFVAAENSGQFQVVVRQWRCPKKALRQDLGCAFSISSCFLSVLWAL